ncbi:IclR family transcriptional regulator [Pseudonocardia nematodicida]|uniref:IclR family transcriptional regulator n=1 Tax=Pseudonocardia nematodicida TaxID=1206997 RepID=A0ABV1KIQ9_9PSEU
MPSGTQTLHRGLQVVAAVATGATDLAAITERTGVSRSTTHRLLQLLTAEGYLRRSATNTYTLGPTFIEYGFLALQQNPLPLVARPVLERLSETYKDTVHLAIRDGDEVLYIDKLTSLRGPETRSRIGYRMPLTRTGIGKALLLGDGAEMWRRLYDADHTGPQDSQEAATQFVAAMHAGVKSGSTTDMEENEPGVRCVAAPIRDGSAAVVAAVSITATRPYMPVARMRALAPVVREAAAEISSRLGYSTGRPATS